MQLLTAFKLLRKINLSYSTIAQHNKHILKCSNPSERLHRLELKLWVNTSSAQFIRIDIHAIWRGLYSNLTLPSVNVKKGDARLRIYK